VFHHQQQQQQQFNSIIISVTIRGVQLAKNDFGSVLQKNCGFRLGFDFTKLTVVSGFWFGFLHCVI